MPRKALSIALSLFMLAAALFVAGQAPTFASYTSCGHETVITFNVDEYTTPDNYTGVVHSQGFYLNPITPGCDTAYEGRNTQCATFRINVLDDPAKPWNDGARGPWIRSCDTPVAMAGGFGGWLDQGAGVTVEARAMQNGIIKGWGGKVFN